MKTRVIIEELQRYSPEFAEKPRWLVFNKTDLLSEDEREALIESILEGLKLDVPVYKVSALNKQGTKDLVRDLMQFIDSLPKVTEEDLAQKVEFKWHDYHQEVLAQAVEEEDDDWDDDWDDGDVEVIYQR